MKTKQRPNRSGRPGSRGKKQWCLLAYDVREPKRLRQLHYYLKKQGLPLQRSVFLLHKKPSELNIVLQEVRQRVDKNVDDVRLYPVVSPNSIWAAGTQSRCLADLYGPVETDSPAKGLRGLVKTLFGKVA